MFNALRKTAIAALAASALALALAAPASATQGIASFSSSVSNSFAGDHPDIETSFTLEDPGGPEAARNVAFNAPEGIFGNPRAMPLCTAIDFALTRCPSNSQIGTVSIWVADEVSDEHLLGTAPIYSLEPGGDQTALLGFIAPGLEIPISIPVTVRTSGDYGLRFTVAELTQATPLARVDLDFWGFPAASNHDAERFPKGSPGAPAGCPGEPSAGCVVSPIESGITVRPLTDNPTYCNGQSLVSTLTVQTYQDPDHLSEKTTTYPPITGCDRELFKPVLFAKPTSAETDSASGLNIEMNDPQPFGFAVTPSQLKSGVLTLPPGLTINPDAADGQTACTDAQANFDSEGPAECPDSAKVGTVSIGSPALEGDLIGSIYLGEPRPGDQYRILLITHGFGINAKLVGHFRPDPQTGQVTASFEDLPQVPFDSFQIHLFASDRGLIATPISCTSYPIEATFTPWNGALAPVTSSQNFVLETGPAGGPCPGQTRPFNPRLEAGTSNSVAGAFSSFTLKLDRDDGDQFLQDLNFRMPPGFTGNLRGIAYCPEGAIAAAVSRSGREEQAAPSCPQNSEIGSTNVAAGPGQHPFHALGRMYLAGPFKGAPISLVALTPALAGPYDYGVVVVRVALKIDPHTAQVSAASDTVPSIVGGVPIRMRSIQVNIDKPNFTINPTNCSPFTVDSQGIGDEGTVTNFSSYFHVDNCGALGFKPRMTVTQLGGKKRTKRTQNASVRFDLYTRPGDANLKSVAVTLPKAFEIDQRHLGNICSKAQLERERCKGRQPIGSASVDTPLLDQPLQGPAFAVSGYGLLPHVAFILAGQVTILPEAESVSVHGGQLQTTVPVVPDAPIGHFRLTLLGGKHGYLINTRDLCAAPATTAVKFVAQNGKVVNQPVKTKAACGKKSAKRKHRSR